MRTADAHNRSDSLKNAARFSLAETPLENGASAIAIRGELDVATSPALRERVAALIDDGVRLLVLDLRAVSFMDSTALAIFIQADRRLGDDGRVALVASGDSQVRLVLEVAGLTRVLALVETLEEAFTA
jgi:anti-sigma B factor antagonist